MGTRRYRKHPTSPALRQKTVPLWVIFLWGFGGGLIALLTPCVWPMIPMTVSFFLKKERQQAQIGSRCRYLWHQHHRYLPLARVGHHSHIRGRKASTSCCRPTPGSTSPSSLLLLVFAISFFGGFDITLPSKWSNSVDAKAERAQPT